MNFLFDPFLVAIYLFLLGLPVGALSDHITSVSHRRNSDLLDALGTFVGGISIALSFPILYPILVITVVLTEIWVAAFQAVLGIF